MVAMAVNLLGATTFARQDGERISLQTRKSQALLIYLIANSGRSVSREEAAHLLWDRSGEEQARASLRQELASLRKILGGSGWDPIETSKESLRFVDQDASIDLAEFAAAVHSEEKEGLKKAAELYSGEFAQGFYVRAQPFEDWLSSERRRLEDLAIQSLIRLLEMADDGDDSISVTETARQLLAIDETNERAHRDLMRAHFENGRRAEALRQYKRCQTVLAKELDISPSVETQTLFREIQQAQQAPTGEPTELEIDDTQPAVGSPSLAIPPQASGERPSATVGAGSHRASPTRSGQRRGLTIALSILAVLLGLPALIGAFQYISEGNQISRSNVLCALPFFQAPEDQTITVGGIMPFEKSFGQRQRWGMLRFLRDNRANYPFNIEFDIRDSKGDLTELGFVLREFEASPPVAVIGPMQSRLAYDAKRWGNARSIPVVSSLASASYLTVPGERDFFFRVGMSDSTRARSLVDWLRAKNLHNNPYILHEWAPPKTGADEPEIYGASQATAAKRHLGQARTLRFTRGDKASQLAAIDQVQNDGRAVLIFGYTSNIKFMIGEMQARGLENDIFLMGVITEELEKPNYPFPDKIHVVTGIVSEASNLSNSAKLRQIFEDDNPGLDYDISAYYAYDSAQMVLDAVQQAREQTCSGRVTGKTVASYLRATPTKRRKVISGGFLTDTQEVFFHSDGLKMVDGKFRRVGLASQ